MGVFGTKVAMMKQQKQAQVASKSSNRPAAGMTVTVAFRGAASLGENPNATPVGMPSDRVINVCSPADAAIECRKAIIAANATPEQWAGGKICYNGNGVATVKHNGNVTLSDGTTYTGHITIT